MAEGIKQINDLLESTGYPVAYRFFPEKDAPSPPFICYLVAYSNNFSADGKAYHNINHIQIELYTKNKDITAEDKVEKALSSFYWEKTEEYIDSEQCYQIIYEIEV